MSKKSCRRYLLVITRAHIVKARANQSRAHFIHCLQTEICKVRNENSSWALKYIFVNFQNPGSKP